MKRSLTLILFMLVASVALVACGDADEGADVNEEATEEEATEEVAVDSGEDIYRSTCASCHANDLAGASGPDLRDLDLTADEIADISVNGHGTMPGGLLEEDEAEIVAEWLLE